MKQHGFGKVVSENKNSTMYNENKYISGKGTSSVHVFLTTFLAKSVDFLNKRLQNF